MLDQSNSTVSRVLTLHRNDRCLNLRMPYSPLSLAGVIPELISRSKHGTLVGLSQGGKKPNINKTCKTTLIKFWIDFLH